jgi:hypothetical protein
VNRLFLCFFLVVASSACRGLERQHFRGLDAAGRAIDTAVAAKSDLARYRQLLGAFSTELSGARTRAVTAEEKTVLAQYESAHTALTDILLIWEAKEARGSDMLPIREPLPERIAREYALGVNTNEPPSIYASEAMQTIWAAARTRLDSARAALRD